MHPLAESFPLLGLCAQRDELPEASAGGIGHGSFVPGGFLAFGHVAHQFLVCELARVFLEFAKSQGQSILLSTKMEENFRLQLFQRMAALVMPVARRLKSDSLFHPLQG